MLCYKTTKMFKLILLICFNVLLINSASGLDSCGKWTAYKDTKCFEILEERVQGEDAGRNCSYLDLGSRLVTIHSKEEQEFLQKLVVKKKITNNLWIGLKYHHNHSFAWEDSWLDYKNWAVDEPTESDDLECVQMSAVTGKWSVESCLKTAYAICEKKQSFDTNLLKKSIEKLEKKLQELEDRTESKLNEIQASPIPIGFIYVQLANQSAPETLFPNATWKDVSGVYAGQFFRAVGGKAESFGKVQQADSSRITQVETLSGRYESWKIPEWSQTTETKIEEGKWSNEMVPGTSYGLFSLKFLSTSGENRPLNSAVKIWKRVK